MTDDYAKLSIRAGFIAGAIDRALGGDKASRLIRLCSWVLTADFLEAIKAEAIRRGVPAQLLERAEQSAAAVASDPQFIQLAKESYRLKSTGPDRSWRRNDARRPQESGARCGT